ncbi:MAG: tyrosine-type recombinase/integrase [Planctomycetaceae bacterium]|nr:tyrosine-type recombinase/integrase [Planctomycetaceae bacterium]
MIRFTTVRDLYRQLYKPQRLPGRSPRTDESHVGTLNQLTKCFKCDLPINELDDEHVAEFVEWLLDKGFSPATVNKHLRNLRALAKFAVRKKQLDEPFDIADLPVDEDDPECWSIDEVSRILGATLLVDGFYGTLPQSLFWECLVLLLLDCGPRIGIFMATRLADVDLDKRLLRIRPKGQRGGVNVRQKQRRGQTLPFSQQTADRLRVLMAFDPNREMLFPWEFDRNSHCLQTLRRHYTKKILRVAGLATDGDCKFHKLRRTTGTYVTLAMGIEAAQRLLGHSSKRVTAQSYIDPSKTHPDVAPPTPACDAIPRPQYAVDRQMVLFS